MNWLPYLAIFSGTSQALLAISHQERGFSSHRRSDVSINEEGQENPLQSEPLLNDNTEVKQNQAVVLDVPLTYNDTLGCARIIKSSEQPFSEQMNPQTGTKDPIFDFDRKELYNANVSVEPFGIQPTYDTLDGRLSISPQPATHVFQNWDLALHSKGDNSERKWLPAGFEPESKYWSDYGIFATTDGFFYAINWNIAARKIKISWRDFSKEYFLTHSDLLKSPLTSKKVIKDRDSLLELNTTYPDPGAVLDSATLWTRLHPWVVDRVYNRIPGVVKFNTTYYLPCDMPSYAIPKISFEIAQTRGAKGGRSTWCPVKKEGFIIKSYKHPESGTIQNAYRDPSLREYPEISPDKVPLARVELGQWVFKSWYMVFKNKKNPKVKEGRRYVGIAQMA
ncbi:hypothetical protein TWF106_007521 [Orbilia oligospora]|uniref:Uncharacterized protein n=1 Tax=Orbilia oligospora TaxID=2813651 RepID=A0A7C8QX24_ORBOL|nr:hypothetical protein TWF106_007521 [Orbilia oligospora]